MKTALTAGAAGIAAASAGVVAFGKSSIDAGSQFDASMSQVAATMGVTTGEIGELRDFAMEMGARADFSATQAADALNYMALAGYDSNEAMEALPNVLNLAAAGGIDLAYASDMVTDAQVRRWGSAWTNRRSWWTRWPWLRPSPTPQWHSWEKPF